MKKLKFLPMVLLLPFISCTNNPPQLGKSPVKDVIAAMTPEEKVKLVVGMGMNYDNIPAGILPPADPADAKIPEKVPGAAGRTHAIPRLGIPSIVVSDGPAGVRINPTRKGVNETFYATAFPVATLMASSWDTTLVKTVGEAFGNEVREYGIDILLGPGMNIHRNPLGGRNFEYYSEDPLIAGNMAAYFVKGIQSNNVGTSVKHFAANNQEFNRMQLNTKVSERALREIYLKGFEITVKKAQPWTVMSSYNYINGTYTSESRDLLTTVLRDEWGFNGFVMTDWFGGKDIAKQANAGNDMIMPGTLAQSTDLLAAVKSGKVSREQIDANVERILNIILKSPAFNNYAYTNKPDLKKHAEVSRTAAAQSMVLLKNDGDALPLAGGKKVALFGNTSYSLIAGGTGSGDVNKPYVISLNQGLANANYQVDTSLQATYQKYIKLEKAKQIKPKIAFFAPTPIAEMPVNASLIQNESSATDAAIITIGRNAGEGGDRKVADDFNLTAAEMQNLKQIANAYHLKGKKVVVVLNIGGVTEINSWKDNVDAIVLAWQPGLEGGNAIADVISGKVNPSGKLATTFPVKYSDVPSAKTFPGKELPGSDKSMGNPLMGKSSEVTYDEGIYVGYRYYTSFNIKTAYPFGYGLSYTTFNYSGLKVSDAKYAGKPITVSVTITNSGKVAGREVAQLYISAPTKGLNKPAVELKGFAKTGLLKAGESQTLTFSLDPYDLSSYNPDQSAWVADAGNYTVKVGASSADIKQTGNFSLTQDIVAKKLPHVLTPASAINELKR